VSGAGPLPSYQLLAASGDAQSGATAEAAGPKASSAPSIERLFEQHYASIWRLLRRFGVRPAQLDDAAQEVFWVAARRLNDVRSGSEQAFLYGVALRVASNLVRRREREPTRAELEGMARLADDGPSPEEALEQARARELLDLVLDHLPLELRTVLVLFELEGLEVRQIAELEQIPVGTASSRLRRAREEFSLVARRVRAALSNRRG
jgi:RNA polymerase sigma-70 factor (ECF subfamily)